MRHLKVQQGLSTILVVFSLEFPVVLLYLPFRCTVEQRVDLGVPFQLVSPRGGIKWDMRK